MSPIEGKADQFSLLSNPDQMEKNQMFLVLLGFSDNKGRASQFMEGHKEWIKRGFDEAHFCWSVVFSLIWAVGLWRIIPLCQIFKTG